MGKGKRPAKGPNHEDELAAERLYEAEALFRDFEQVTPFQFRPFVKSFDSFEAFDRWKREQTNPWYR